mmetsp:Transcript_84097/g.214078  ORF Transcript_84097/g.214078 Transcript_84097/m.214078 type:complete len:213 (+) Transcript_84097:125-763(+)
MDLHAFLMPARSNHEREIAVLLRVAEVHASKLRGPRHVVGYVAWPVQALEHDDVRRGVLAHGPATLREVSLEVVEEVREELGVRPRRRAQSRDARRRPEVHVLREGRRLAGQQAFEVEVGKDHVALVEGVRALWRHGGVEVDLEQDLGQPFCLQQLDALLHILQFDARTRHTFEGQCKLELNDILSRLLADGRHRLELKVLSSMVEHLFRKV